MSAELHVELLRRLADAINTGDIPRGLLTDDFEAKNATTAVTDATYHGYDGALPVREDAHECRATNCCQ